MTSDAMNGPMRSTQPVAIRWRRYLSELAAMQPPPPPAIVRLASSGRLTAADSLTMLCEQHRSCVFRPPFCDQESLCTGPQLRALRGVFAVADGSLNSFVGRVSISFGTPVRYVSTGLTRCAPNLQLSFVGCPIADGVR
jgi:hypothetical protein